MSEAAEAFETIDSGVQELKKEEKSKAGLYAGASVAFLGKTTIEIAKVGVFFLAFYYVWAYLGLSLLPTVAIFLVVGLLLFWIGNGIKGLGWNPMNYMALPA